MITDGKVESIDGETANVLVRGNSVCGDCECCKKQKKCIINCENKLNAKVGDIVTVEISGINPSRIAFLIFGVALLVASVVAILFEIFNADEIYLIVAEFVFFIGSVLVGILIAKRMIKKIRSCIINIKEI